MTAGGATAAGRFSTGLDMAALGVRIRMARRERTLSLAAVAERAGVSRSMLSAVERGRKVPTVLVLDRIATALDTSIARLLGEERAARVMVLRHGGPGRRAGPGRVGAEDPLPSPPRSRVRADADHHRARCRRGSLRAARRRLPRVPRRGARHAPAHRRWNPARPSCRRQRLLRGRLPPPVRQPGPRALRLLPRDGAGGERPARSAKPHPSRGPPSPEGDVRDTDLAQHSRSGDSADDGSGRVPAARPRRGRPGRRPPRAASASDPSSRR